MRVLPGPCYVISDAHLGVAPREAERALVAFLRHARGDARSIIVNGDLFDFWFEWRSVIPRVGYRVLAALTEFADAGVPVVWVGGNHDCWGGEFLRDDAGIDFVLGTWRGTIAGWQSRVDHGDGLRHAEDRRYRALRVLLRNRLAIRVFRWVHPDIASHVALGSSAASRTYAAKDRGEGLRQVAHRDLAGDPRLELLIFGHSHVAVLEKAPSGGVYGNAGTWLGDSTYLRIDERRISLCRWADGKSAEVAAVER